MKFKKKNRAAHMLLACCIESRPGQSRLLASMRWSRTGQKGLSYRTHRKQSKQQAKKTEIFNHISMAQQHNDNLK
jgi:hypothetical protein